MTNVLHYETQDIPLRNLSVIWVKAQRPFNEKWAKQLAEEFDPDKFEPLCVTKPNGVGMYHIIDGQHRKAAVEAWLGSDPNQKITCRVISEADPARAAELWLGINEGRKKIRPVPAFLVAVEAKREIEVAVNAIVRKTGYHVSENTQYDNSISAVGALKKVYVSCSPYILTHTLQICRLMWGSDSKGVSGSIVTGLAVFLNEFHVHVDKTHLAKCITSQYRSPNNFLEAVRLESEKSSETMDIAMSELVRRKYNHGLREAKKLKRKEN